MSFQDVFRRYEKKFMLNEQQYRSLRSALEGTMSVDEYGKHTIGNVYFDTDDYRLIRASLEKPVYKEKLRVRSYGVPAAQDQVFVELKKKYDGVVYKRRASMTLDEAEAYLLWGERPREETQITREIDWFMNFYHPVPKVYLAYDRVALFGKEDPELRITFDTDIRFRQTALSLWAGDSGAPLLSMGQYLMEVKIPGAMPLWMSHLFDQCGIFSTSFSKYGAVYQNNILFQKPVTAGQKGVVICA